MRHSKAANVVLVCFLLLALLITGCQSTKLESEPSASAAEESTSDAAANEDAAESAEQEEPAEPEEAEEPEEPAEAAAGTDYPTKPVQVICGYGSGGDADINGRILCKYLEKYLGESFVVSNVTGAGGSVGARQVVDSDPDGYTMLVSHWGSLMNTLMGIGEYDLVEDFEIAGIYALDSTTLFVTSANGKYKTMTEVMEAAKANPGEVKFSIEVGSVVHLTASVLQAENGVELHLIDTGDNANRIASVMSNQVDVAVFQYGAVKDYLESGDFIALGAVCEDRNPNYPDIPTVAEQGVTGLDAFYNKFFWVGFPKGTPQEIVDVISDAMEKVSQDPDAQKEFEAMCVDLVYLDSDESVELINNVRDSFTPFMDTLES